MANNILDGLSVALLSVDHELRVRYINQSAQALLDVSAARSSGLTVSDIIGNGHELETIMYDALQSGQPYSGRKITLKLPTGKTATVDFSLTPFNDEEWPRLLIEMHPLDRYLRIEGDESSREHYAVARQMVRGLAHEIKNPLGGIRGSAQLLARELDDDGQREFTDIIISETDRLTALVDNLLGPNHVARLQPTNVHELLERVVRLIEIESEQKISFVRDYDPSIPDLSMDPEMMVQVFLNIARNAMQSLADTPSPEICIATRVDRNFTIGSKIHRMVTKVDIIDNGPGISEELKDHLFYPMITGRKDGTGLGLSLAQSLVHQHSGLIELDSEPGCTRFSIIIPLELS
ncbi:MAG: nitrogen regulation protein NR(II) [Pseudomonadota bacterium]